MNEESFTVQGESGNYLRIIFEEVYGFPETTCGWGGYDLRSSLEIESSSFKVKATLFTTTGELFLLYQQLRKYNELLTRSANYSSYEGNLEFIAQYDNLGHVSISGRFAEQTERNNVLLFEFITDQTFIRATLSQLEQIAGKYGGMEGIK